MTKYTSVKIPVELAYKIQGSKIYQNLSYRSISEFVLDATRRRLE